MCVHYNARVHVFMLGTLPGIVGSISQTFERRNDRYIYIYKLQLSVSFLTWECWGNMPLREGGLISGEGESRSLLRHSKQQRLNIRRVTSRSKAEPWASPSSRG